MAPVESDGFHLREGEGEGGADLQRVRQVLILHISAAARLPRVVGVSVADDSMLRHYRWGWRQLTELYLGVCVIKRIEPYLSLRRSFEGKT